MDYLRIPEKLKNILLMIFIILFLQLIFFVEKIYASFLFVVFLLFCWFFFIFMDNQAKKEELKNLLKLRENRIKYLFKEFPKEFP
jgi:energy-coupling factor transporter transmembrane protein EcfT